MSAEGRVENQKLNQTAELCCSLVEFLVFNSICLKKSVPSNGRNRVVILNLKTRRSTPCCVNPALYSERSMEGLRLTLLQHSFGRMCHRQLDLFVTLSHTTVVTVSPIRKYKLVSSSMISKITLCTCVLNDEL